MPLTDEQKAKALALLDEMRAATAKEARLGARAASKLANSSGASVSRKRKDASMSKSSKDEREEHGDAVDNIRATLS